MVMESGEGSSRLADGFVHSRDSPESLLSCVAELVNDVAESTSAFQRDGRSSAAGSGT
jgi:hypothetical protein